jgi:hypothetical protein|tara:strand:- start:106 stop:567 length:462 start_codon:yes stop_codon:yes gene_type:complete
MSYDTHKNWFYKRHGKIIRLYRLRKTSHRVVDSEGRVSPSGSDELIYPDETIPNGLRVEYTALVKPFVNGDPDTVADASLVEVTSPKEGSHVNLNRMLSLAVVEYVKAQFAERKGDIKAKEYFMNQFYNKLADNESNQNNVFVANTMRPFAVK